MSRGTMIDIKTMINKLINLIITNLVSQFKLYTVGIKCPDF